ncbi:Glycogen synthase [Serratia quinivorans]|nr:Glycogen synthase [Serratia quinivorans]CAI1906105.1 Glycogen synthase [Serratia quinivorans]
MRIMIVNTLYHPNKVGGAEVSVQLLAEELARKGHKVRVICLHQRKERVKNTINDVEVVYLPLKNIYWPFDDERKSKIQRLIWHIIDSYNIFMARAISKEINHFSPDVVHTNNIAGFSVAIWSAIKNTGSRLIHTSRDYYLFHPNSTMFSQDRNMGPEESSVKFWSFGKKKASKNVDLYIGISDFIRKFHIKNGFFPNAKSEYIYNAVEKMPIDNFESKELRFGFIGRLTKDKGFDVYCELVDRFKDKYPTAKFYAAGRFIGSESGEELECLAKRKGVNLLGFIPASQFLSQVDIVVLPIKWREPFGRVVLESVLANKFVLTNAVGGVSELGKLFPTIYFMEDMDKIDFSIKSFEVTNDVFFNCSEITNKYVAAYTR